ncbi:hypothetical protein C8F04DRAFT_1272085 [Mycena alexandri]|uniref:Uncharacterized protein n=1 Tax=Mycena alexandri TaxID=1745969 RepID=A0AAD6S844_9AGAR|nr:hypothetical protein C8F04DRAFT_1272085 [Mycena alexandri]
MPKALGNKAEAQKAPKKKPGNKGDFRGMREDFLTCQLPEYFKKSKQGKVREFWGPLLQTYWQLFPWRLELDQDPDPEDGLLREALLPEEFDLKVQKMAQVKAKIKTWFNHQRGGAGMTASPWSPWLSRLRRPSEPCPKRISDYQYYMQHDAYKDKIARRFAAEYPNVGRDEALAARCKVARALFEAESTELKSQIHDEAKKEHERLVAKWKDAEEGLPSLDEVDQEEARRRFTATVAPLLEGLRAHTGYYIMLVAGREVEGKFDVLSVHSGKTKADVPEKEQNFAQWGPGGYQRVLDEFVRFIAAAGSEPMAAGAGTMSAPFGNGAAAAGTSGVGSTAPPPVAPAVQAAQAAPAPAPADNPAPAPAPAPANRSAPSGSVGLHALGPDDDTEMPMALIDPLLRRPVTPPPVGSLAARMMKLGVTSPLLESLETMSPTSKEKRVRSLEGMSKHALQRENNAARREKALGAVRGTVVSPDKTPRPPKKASTTGRGRKRAPNAGRNKARKRPRRGEEEEESDSAEESSGSEGDDEVQRVEAPTTRGKARAQAGNGGTANIDAQGSGAGSTEGVEGTGDSGGAPKWAVEGKGSLERGTEAWGAEWTKLVGLWWELESSTGFRSLTKGFRTAGRPDEIGHWVKCARKGAPSIVNAAAFAVNWEKWWKGINPKWRVGTDGALKRGEVGGWDTLEAPGPNGFLNVLIGLKWWKDAGGDGDWPGMVDDVTWVLEMMLAEKAA